MIKALWNPSHWPSNISHTYWVLVTEDLKSQASTTSALMSKSALGVNEDIIERNDTNNGEGVDSEKADVREAHEVFQKSSEGVDFRTVSW